MRKCKKLEGMPASGISPLAVRGIPKNPGSRGKVGPSCDCYVPPFLFSGMSGARLLGIHHDAVIFLAEQLPGAQHCQHYKFRYHQQGEGQEEPPLNPHGAARAEVYLRSVVGELRGGN